MVRLYAAGEYRCRGTPGKDVRILLSEKVFVLLRGESVDLAAPEGKFATGDFRSDHSSRKNMVLSA